MTTLSTEQTDAVAALHRRDRRDRRDRRPRGSRWHNRFIYLASLAVTASAWAAALFFLGRYLLAAIARGLR